MHDGDDESDLSHAADEPTAMWDESALKELGIESEQKATGPATTGTGKHRAIGVELVGGNQPATPKKKKSAALSWFLTILLAVALGVGMFFLVRTLR